MSAKYKKMYENPPEVEQDDAGKMRVKDKMPKGEAVAPEVGDGTAEMGGGVPTHIRHSIERREMSNRHESEHLIHDHGKAPKEEMHSRHLEDMKTLHKKHEKELKKHGEKHKESQGSGSGQEKIEKTENNKE